MGGAPPPPHNSAPQGAKKPEKFGPKRSGFWRLSSPEDQGGGGGDGGFQTTTPGSGIRPGRALGSRPGDFRIHRRVAVKGEYHLEAAMSRQGGSHPASDVGCRGHYAWGRFLGQGTYTNRELTDIDERWMKLIAQW